MLRDGISVRKGVSYIVNKCRHRALNSYFRGRSICSKPRSDISFVDLETHSESLSNPGLSAWDRMCLRLLIRKIERRLTERERRIWWMVSQGYTLAEIGKSFQISTQRVSQLWAEARATAALVRKRWFNLEREDHSS